MMVFKSLLSVYLYIMILSVSSYEIQPLEDSELQTMIDNAQVIDGVREPDDDTDQVTHRNGVFMNNEFYPYTQVSAYHSSTSVLHFSSDRRF